MSEITFIKNGYATTIHDDGSMTTTLLDKCDQCQEWSSQTDGLQVRDVGREIVIWLCAQCRA